MQGLHILSRSDPSGPRLLATVQFDGVSPSIAPYLVCAPLPEGGTLLERGMCVSLLFDAPDLPTRQLFLSGRQGQLLFPYNFSQNVLCSVLLDTTLPTVGTHEMLVIATLQTATPIPETFILPTGSSAMYLPLYTNVKDYGALGDGVSDDSVAILKAVAAVGNNGTVIFPAGNYICPPLPLIAGVGYSGAGRGVTTLTLQPSANTDFFSADTNLIGLNNTFGAGSGSGVGNWFIRDMTINGNRANQSSGTSYPLRFYGYNFLLHNLDITGGYSGGVQCDWNGGDINFGPEVEASWENIRIFENNGVGLKIGGPHDMVFSQVLIMRNGSHNVHIAPNARGLLWMNSHSWGTPWGVNAVPWLVEANSCQFMNCVGEGADTTNLVLLCSDTSWTGGSIYAAGTNAVYGIQLGQNAGGTPYPGSIAQSGGVTTSIASSYNQIQTKITNCENGAINEANTSSNMLQCLVKQTAGTAIASGGGYLGGSSSAWLMVAGLTPDGSQGKGGTFQLSGETSYSGMLFYDGSGNQILSMNSFNGGLALGSARLLQGYSDTSFSVRTFQTDMGTGNIVTSGNLSTGQSTAAASLLTNGTITIGNLGSVIVAPTANVTGIILSAGSVGAQEVSITNQSAFTITFAASGTSRIADGVSDVITANSARAFKWNSLNSLWYHL